ncbi:hypothetical protein BLA29_012445, partial [Euroglyphus maynei]
MVSVINQQQQIIMIRIQLIIGNNYSYVKIKYGDDKTVNEILKLNFVANFVMMVSS